MDDVKEIVNLFYNKENCSENDDQIRDYFMDSYSVSSSIDHLSISEPNKNSCDKAKVEPKIDNFYQNFMEEELNNYKEKLKLAKIAKVNNDSNSSKRNVTNKLLLDTSEQFVINKTGNWTDLCILDSREELVKAIRNNQVVIIKGFTGCGKSTQVPQYVAVDCQNRGQPYNIIVTQPRRVAAKMLATRVSYELGCSVGSLVGYQIGLDRARDSKLTKILYCTTGVLLQRLIMSSNANTFTHIFLDEIHERSADMDMLFLTVKKLVYEQKINARLILMSATCDVDLFQDYFNFHEYILSRNYFVSISPAVFQICSPQHRSGNVFRQEIFYLDDIAGKLGDLKINYTENFLKYRDFDDFLMKNGDECIDFNKEFPILHNILHEVVLGILYHGIEIPQIENKSRGTVLIFLPGIAEILELFNILKTSSFALKYKWKFFILHSTVSLKEQTAVMRAPDGGSRHIILATNIAESSLTVPNVEFVIDYCLFKTLIASRQGYNMTYLTLEWSSKSSSDQRAGRTGRTNDGQVFRLIPAHFYQTLHTYETPEFEKTPLENYVLKAKLIDKKLPPKNVLAYALNPPKLTDVEKTILTLKRVGALTVYSQKSDEQEYYYDNENGNLTALGYVMAFLPLDIMLSKFVALGLVFDVTYEAIVIASAHCTPGFFIKNSPDPINSYKAHLSWSNRSLSDSLAYLKAYRMYKTLESKFTANTSLAQKWCLKNNIEYQRLLELETLICEIVTRLEMNLKINIDFSKRSIYKKSDQDLILKVVISGAFYPNYFVRSFADKDLIQRYNSVINCENTVILNCFGNDRLITTLYTPFLKKMFEPCSSKIDFKINENIILMTLDSKNNELSIENEDHPLYRAYSSHINSQQIGQSKGANLLNWSSFQETNIHSSVYLALALKRFNRNSININRFRANIEQFYKNQIIQNIEKNYFLLSEDDSNAKRALSENKFIANVSQNPCKYLLPKMPKLSASTRTIGLRVCNFLSPQLFYVLYKHSYVDKMLYNIDLLTSSLILKSSQDSDVSSSKSFLLFSEKRSTVGSTASGNTSGVTLEIGDFVIAPLNIQRFQAISFLVNDYHISKHYIDQYENIMARAEVIKISLFGSQPMVYLYFVDFGITDTLPMVHGHIHRLSCHFKYLVGNILRDVIEGPELEQIETLQDIYDKLFCIPPLAVRSELVRVKPLSRVEFVGNWMPQVKNFLVDYCSQQEYLFTAEVYAFLNDRLLVELYPICEVSSDLDCSQSTVPELLDNKTRNNISLNELLVKKKFAEFKLESEVCPHMNFRYDMSRYNESTSQTIQLPTKEFLLIFEEDASEPMEFQFDIGQLTMKTAQKLTENVFRLRGPISPLEVRFSGMSRLNAMKNVVISSNSINSVALEPDITAKHARLLVSGEINLSDVNQNLLMLLNTTFMPNIIDFPAIMCLLFSPFVELRVNKLVSKRSYGMPEEICGAICGIGFDPVTSCSYDPQNDIDLFFDSSINLEDIELINLLRYQISQFFFIEEQHVNTPTDRVQANFNLEMNLNRRQRKCRQILFQLLSRTRINRKWFDYDNVSYPNFKWNAFNIVTSELNDRVFAFKEFSQKMLNTINMKTAVLIPISIPLLNPESSVVEWEDAVMENLNFMENENFDECFDENLELYICKLCMFQTSNKFNFHAHLRQSIGETTHSEAAYIFKKYYPIWKGELNQMKQLAEASQEEQPPDRVGILDAFENEGSTFDCCDYQLGLINDLEGGSKHDAVAPNPYHTLANAKNDQPNMRMSKESNKWKNPYGIDTLKRNIDNLIEHNKWLDGDNKSVSSRSVYDGLSEYFDDDEISILNHLNVI